MFEAVEGEREEFKEVIRGLLRGRGWEHVDKDMVG